jgi:enoyl-CoA hydratase
MRSDFETIVVSRYDNLILLVTLNRPEVSNALNTRMGLDLMELFEALSIDLEGLRAVIITGSGNKAFCAGGDLKERNGMTDESWQSQHVIFERMVRAMMGCPLMAAVNGAAYGGGCEIAAASDFVYAATNARFALTEVTLGIMPGAGGTQNLARAVGERRAQPGRPLWELRRRHSKSALDSRPPSFHNEKRGWRDHHRRPA